MDAPRPQSLDREGCGQRRVDPTRNPDDDLGEAILVDVVAQTELEADTHLLQLVELRRNHGLDRLARAARRADMDHRDVGEFAAVTRERAAADVPKPTRDRVGRLDGDNEERLPEARPAREQISFLVEHERVAVEEQLVLAADRIDEGDKKSVL